MEIIFVMNDFKRWQMLAEALVHARWIMRANGTYSTNEDTIEKEIL